MNAVIIPAGGKGLRMESEIPKQFIPVGGIPILMRTIKLFYDYDPDILIVTALPYSQIEYWQNLCKEYKFDIDHKIARGGEERFFSVRNALEYTFLADYIAIHDAVRPFTESAVIHRCFESARLSGAAIPVTALTDSIRHITDAGESEPVPRNQYRSVQTPQVFRADILHEAYKAEYCEEFTDDASVVESYGTNIVLVEGSRENIKITTSLDMKIAELLIKNENKD